MIASIFYFAYNKQFEIHFKRKISNFVGDMQSFQCEIFVLWTGVEVFDTTYFVMRET